MWNLLYERLPDSDIESAERFNADRMKVYEFIYSYYGVQAARSGNCGNRRVFPASVGTCDRIGASRHIPVKHLANSNVSQYIMPQNSARWK